MAVIDKRFSTEIEKKWQSQWEKDGIYSYNENDASGAPVYSIDTPPPFTSGELHMGHVLSYSYFDFVARYKRMQGFNVYYPQGWDCQGFPTEVKVEAKHGHREPREFRQLCVEWTMKSIERMKSQMVSLGFSPDWRYEYRTMDKEYHRKVQLSLLQMFEKGLVYRGAHPIYYCPKCASALAKTDTEDIERTTTLSQLVFTGQTGAKYPIATTRPEFLHACVAVLYHPDDERYNKLGEAGEKTLTTPLEKEVPLIADKDVLKDFGTGLVMVCTFGDKQDVVWYYRHSLPYVQAIDKYGKLMNSGQFDGISVKEAKQKVIEHLKEKGLVEKQEQLSQVVKHHDRCKSEIEYIISTQWFARVKEKAPEIIAAAKSMRWVPGFAISYLVDWAENVEWDWIISRQRVFGTPLPFWHCEKCNEVLTPPHNALPVYPGELEMCCPKCKEVATPELSTCDCWVDSSITPLVISGWPDGSGVQGSESRVQSSETQDPKPSSRNPKPETRNFEKLYPASLRPQGVEIIRTWAYYTIYRCLMLTGKPCFKELLLNGNVLAPDGKKMSKSLGNVIVPDQLITEYGADSVRLWAALSGAMAKDRPFSYEDIKYARMFLTKLWNSARFVNTIIEKNKINANNMDFTSFKEGQSLLHETDRWILQELDELVKASAGEMDSFNFHTVAKKLMTFYWNSFCDYYIEYLKHRAYSGDEKEKRVATYVALYVLNRMLRLLAPFTSHISEEIYSIIFSAGSSSVHKSGWPKPENFAFQSAVENLKLANLIVGAIRSHKAANKLAMNAELANVKCTLRAKQTALPENLLDDIRQTCKVKALGLQFDGSVKEGEEPVVVSLGVS